MLPERHCGLCALTRPISLPALLGAICGAADLRCLGVNLLDRVEHPLWVGRLIHGALEQRGVLVVLSVEPSDRPDGLQI